MNDMANAAGILVIGHGSPRAEANQGFVALVDRVASRLGTTQVLPAFFSIARPNIQDQVAELVSRGLRRVVLMPYFLYSGQHVTVDIPTLLAECRRLFPEIALELLPTLENEPTLEDMVVERLTPFVASAQPLPCAGAAIEERSYQLIDGQLAGWDATDSAVRRIVRRVIHATADVSFARTLRIHPQAVERGLAAIGAKKPIVCDVRMVQAGLTKVTGEVICAIDQDQVAALAQQNGCTRAAAGMELLASQLDGAIVAIGNAPTALWKILEMARNGGPRPALVVGLPVGFVGARESKQALLESGLCYITNLGPRGGSPVAAAAVNALATLQHAE